MFAAVRRSIATPSARAFSTTRASRVDVAKLTLVGRLGREPELRVSRSDKEYVVYTVATRNSLPPASSADGTRPNSDVTWHNVYSFSTPSNNYLRTLPRGALVYVEAAYELRDVEPADENGRRSKQVFLRHETLRLLSRPAAKDGEEQEQEEHQ